MMYSLKNNEKKWFDDIFLMGYEMIINQSISIDRLLLRLDVFLGNQLILTAFDCLLHPFRVIDKGR